jgi:DNA polymerase-3 subunit gamma/tau
MAIARFAKGGLRDALQLLGQVSLLGEAVTANHAITHLETSTNAQGEIIITHKFHSGDCQVED